MILKPPTKRHQPEAIVNEKHNVFEKYAIPELLRRCVVAFFWDDPTTFRPWLQACRQNHSLCLDKMSAMKVWWEEVQSLVLREDVRKMVFHASFTKKLDLYGFYKKNKIYSMLQDSVWFL